MSVTAPAKRKTKRAKHQVRWREGSKHRAQSFDTKKAADDFRAEVRLRRQRGEAVVHPNETATLDDFATAWLKRRREGGTSLGTRKVNRSIYNRHISPYLGHQRVGELKVKVLDDWQADLRSAGASIHTRRRATGLLAMILDDVVRREDGLTGNPARALPAIRDPREGGERRKGQAVSPEQVESMRAHFLAAKRPADAALISILAYVGLRPEEALAVEPDNITTRTAEFDLRADQTKDKTPARTTTIPKPIRAEVRATVKALPDGAARIFLTAGGQPWGDSDYRNWRRRHFKPAATAAGLPDDFRPYDLRHTCASLMLRAGTPATDVAEHLGHSIETLLSVYAHAIKEMKGQPAVPLDKAIRAARVRR
jgi:integrase